ncbi:MAG: DUF2029 domain-containing protein [Anaerolineae bacterium]|nr:DUF2029 domain-containing protein [Anaerolineae bacterium]
MSRRSLAWIVAILVAAYLIGAAGIYAVLMSDRVVAIWDFYQLWYSARVLLEGRDPYDAQVALEMQQALYGRPALPSEGRPDFYYPLPLLLLVLPLSALPYPVAAAAWLSLLLFAAAGAVGATLWGLQWRAPAPTMGGLVLWALALFPVLWSLLLGQVSVLLLFFLCAGLAALLRQRDGLAGPCLALTALKPQLVYLLLPLLGLWAVVNRRWRFLLSGAATAIGLTAVAALFLPPWPVLFWRKVTTYAAISPFAAPLQVLCEQWLGLPASWPWVLAALLLGLCLALWLRTGVDPRRLARAAGVTLVVSALTIPRIGMINQLTLLWPVLVVLKEFWRQRRWGRIAALAVSAAMLVVPWAIAATVAVPADAHRYEVEHQAMAPLLPLLLGAAFATLWATSRRHGAGHE